MTSAFRYPWVAIGATAIAVMTAGFFQSAHAAGTSVESSQSVATVDSSQSATASGMAIDQAATDANRQAMTACKKLPPSERGTCADEAGYGAPAIHRSLSPAQQTAIDREDARYERAMAACSRLPLSERTTCASRAGDDSTLAPMK